MIDEMRREIHRARHSLSDVPVPRTKEELIAYVPEEYRPHLTDIYDDGTVWDPYLHEWVVRVSAKWTNGITTFFNSAEHCLYSLTNIYKLEDVSLKSKY